MIPPVLPTPGPAMQAAGRPSKVNLQLVVQALVAKAGTPTQVFPLGMWDTAAFALGLPEEKRGSGEVIQTTLQGVADTLVRHPDPASTVKMIGGAAKLNADYTEAAAKALSQARTMASGPPEQRVAVASQATPFLQSMWLAEQPSLDQVLLSIPPEKQAEASEAIADFLVSVGDAIGVVEPSLAQKEAGERMAKLSGSEAGTAEAWAQILGDGARMVDTVLEGNVFKMMAMMPLAKAGTQLHDKLAELVVASPEAKAALHDVREDLEASFKVHQRIKTFGGLVSEVCKRPGITQEQAIAELQPRAEAMGISIVKMAQKMGSVLRILQRHDQRTREKPDGATEPGVSTEKVMTGLVNRLQDSMTPMTQDVLLSQLRLSFPPGRKLFPGDTEGKPDEEPVFLRLDLKAPPKGSASMAQLQRGWMRDPESPSQAIEIGSKIFRPGALEDLNQGVRACRFMERCLEAYKTTQTKVPAWVSPVKFMVGVQRQVTDSFKVEVQADLERTNMNQASRNSAFHDGVYVPRAIESASGQAVITMPFVRGRSYAVQADRMLKAQEAFKEATPPGGIEPGNTAEAEQRAGLWARRTYGMVPAACTATVRPGAPGSREGFDVAIQFKDTAYPQVAARVGLDGQVTSEARKPDLSVRALRRSLVRVMAEVFSQVLHRHIHGDGQGGNLMHADVSESVSLDWGNTIQFNWKDMLLPARMTVAFMFRDYKRAARAIVSMSEFKDKSRAERAPYEAQIQALLETRAAERAAKLKKELEEAKDPGEAKRLKWMQRGTELVAPWSQIPEALQAAEIQLQPLYFRLFNAMMATGGTVGALAQDAGLDNTQAVVQTFASLVGTVAWNSAKDFTVGFSNSQAAKAERANTQRLRESGVLAFPRPVEEILAEGLPEAA